MGGEKFPGYEPSVLYEYTVRGTRYTGETLAFVMDTGLPLGKAETIARKYREGSTVAVYYDPNNPANSALERGITAVGPIAGLLIGGLVLVIALLMLRSAIRGY